jgi:hypothetical protein
MNLVYVFIGSLPKYSIDTVHQTRLFYDGPIYFIISDYESPYVKILESYNVTIVKYDEVICREFNEVLEKTYSKFCIVDKLVGREKLFIYSFERFFVLYMLMHQRNIQDIFFMELDNLIYDSPLKWLEQFSRKEMAIMFDRYDGLSSGVCYIKNLDILKCFCEFSLLYILHSNEFLSEMRVLVQFYGAEANRIQLLPILWPDSQYPIQAYETFPIYNSIFDAAAIGIYIGGIDPYHVGEDKEYKKIYGNKSGWSLIDYTVYSYKWERDELGRNIPYVYNGTSWIRINNLHVHSKELKPMLSIPLNLPE